MTFRNAKTGARGVCIINIFKNKARPPLLLKHLINIDYDEDL